VIGDHEDPLPGSKGERWEAAAKLSWRWVIERTLDDDRKPTAPGWFDRPATRQYHISTPRLLKAFTRANDRSDYAGSVKPFSFLLTAQAADPDLDVRLAAPYRRLPHDISELRWLDTKADRVIDRRSYGIVTEEEVGELPLSTGTVVVRSLGSVIAAHRRSPEAKTDEAAAGEPSGRGSRGLLVPPVVDVVTTSYVGKEMQLLDEVRAGVKTASEAQISYGAAHDPELEAIGRAGQGRVATASGSSLASVQALGRGSTRQAPELRRRILRAARSLMREDLTSWGEPRQKGSNRRLALQYLDAWWYNVGSFAAAYPDTVRLLRTRFSTAAITWIGEQADVDRGTVLRAEDAFVRAKIVGAGARAVELTVNPQILRASRMWPPTMLQLVHAGHQQEVAEDYQRNKMILAGIQDEEESARRLNGVSSDLRARSDRHDAELRYITTIEVPEPVPTEVKLIEACTRLYELGFGPVCPICQTSSLLLGETVCARPACRKAAGRRVRVDFVKKGSEQMKRIDHETREAIARVAGEIEDEGYDVNRRAVAREFGVSPQTVARILDGPTARRPSDPALRGALPRRGAVLLAVAVGAALAWWSGGSRKRTDSLRSKPQGPQGSRETAE
jgi:hypothetical protein